MVAAGIFPRSGLQILSQLLVDPNYDWHANIQLSYTETSYANASKSLNLMIKQYPSDFSHAELPAVTCRDLNQKQMLCFDMVIEAVRNKYQRFLL